MALWLCRLEPDGLEAVDRDDARARQLGIGGWVLPVQLGQGAEAAMLDIHRLFEVADGLPLLLEWLIKEPCEASEESWLIARLGGLMSMPRAVQLEGRPALLTQGSDQLDQPSLTARRMRRALAQRLGRVPLLLNAAGEAGEGFDGCCDWTEPPFVDGGVEKRHHRASYELFLQQAHWRPSPQQALSIPSVRALAPASSPPWMVDVHSCTKAGWDCSAIGVVCCAMVIHKHRC